MKAYGVQNGNLKQMVLNEPEVGKGQVKIKMKSFGLNHRDLHIPDRYGVKENPLIIGSDGAGIVEDIWDGESRFQIGEEVVINPSLNWYENSDAPPENFEIVGMPSHGTFAEKFVISEDFVEKKPDHLNWEEAGVFALAGLTGFRALITKGQIQEKETLFIPGVGSGVHTHIILFAKAKGARVITTTRDSGKMQFAKELGADVVLNTFEDWEEALRNEKIDLVIESVGGATFNRSLDVLKKGGRMVTFGSSTNDEITFNLRKFFYGQYKMFGTTMGSREEFRYLLSFMEQHHIKPVLDKVFLFNELDQAFERLDKQHQFGKIAIRYE
nr:zinc-binding dehydrogenase [Gracilibacillus sp. YIM 98692]